MVCQSCPLRPTLFFYPKSEIRPRLFFFSSICPSCIRSFFKPCIEATLSSLHPRGPLRWSRGDLEPIRPSTWVAWTRFAWSRLLRGSEGVQRDCQGDKVRVCVCVCVCVCVPLPSLGSVLFNKNSLHEAFIHPKSLPFVDQPPLLDHSHS